MNENGIVRRRHLPHIDVEGKPFFVTACLHGSVSALGLREIRDYRDQLENRTPPNNMSPADWEMMKHKLVFRKFDDLLDGECPVKHLADERLAKVVQDAFLHFAGTRYKLLAYVVMPSHHHWLFLPDSNWSATLPNTGARQRTPREVISHSIQSYTATMCNRLLNRHGKFWLGETFDHYVRDDAELFRIINYIENNPVKAGLVARPELYPWSSANMRLKLGLKRGEGIVLQ